MLLKTQYFNEIPFVLYGFSPVASGSARSRNYTRRITLFLYSSFSREGDDRPRRRKPKRRTAQSADDDERPRTGNLGNISENWNWKKKKIESQGGHSLSPTAQSACPSAKCVLHTKNPRYCIAFSVMTISEFRFVLLC